jgi:hypothetical protein
MGCVNKMLAGYIKEIGSNGNQPDKKWFRNMAWKKRTLAMTIVLLGCPSCANIFPPLQRTLILLCPGLMRTLQLNQKPPAVVRRPRGVNPDLGCSVPTLSHAS